MLFRPGLRGTGHDRCTSSNMNRGLRAGDTWARAEGHGTHLRSGSPCLHSGSCWKSGDWAKGGRRGQKEQTENTSSKKDSWTRWKDKDDR